MPARPPTVKRCGSGEARPDTREAPSRRGYGRLWQRVRRVHLAHNPLCVDCLDRGRETAATEVDHVESLARGGTHDGANLRSLCKSCHSRKTVAVDGGLGNAKG